MRRSGSPAAARAHQLGLVAVAISLSASGCAGDPAEPGSPRGTRDVLIGTVGGTDARVGVVRDEGRWVAYVCGGPSTLSELTGWFEGDVAGDGSTSDGAMAGKRLALTFGDRDVRGTIETAAATFALEAASVDAHGAVGLFDAVDRGCRTGLVVPPEGQGDPQGVYCAELDASGRPIATSYQQVTPILPLVLTDRGIDVRIAGEDRSLYLRPVAPALH